MDLSAIEAYTRNIGSDPEDTFRLALEKAGSSSKQNPDGQWTSNCPGPNHSRGDQSPSLHWHQTTNHRVVFHCFAGCEYEDVLKALSLRRYQLYPVRQEYDYFDAEGTYRFTVRRVNTATGEKKVFQVRRNADGTEDSGNGLADGESFLWLEPDLESFAEDARASNRKFTLWLPEGEKDAVAVTGSGALGEWEFATTAPGGAGAWKPAHTARIRDLFERGALSDVVVLCDGDPAGAARGFAVREALSTIEDLPVRVLRVDPGDDVADLCDILGATWTDSLSELTDSDIADALEEGSAVTGHMRRMPLGPGAAAGRRQMGIVIPSSRGENVLPVLLGEVTPKQAWDSGWVVDVAGPKREPRELVLSHSDLTSKNAFDRWLARAGIAMVPKCGVGADQVASSLRMWLDWWTDTHGVPKVVVTEHLTWVDPRTGEPAIVASEVEPPVFVTPEDDGSETGVRWIGTDRAGSHWERRGTELDAAWATARALTFGDRRSVVSVVGWAAAMLLAPWLGKWLDTKPGLAVVAPSGTGKTHGAARLLLQLAGCDGSGTSSIAGLRRRLAQGGVSAIQWIDDSAILDDHHLKEILRIAASGSEHTLANPDAGATATNTAKLIGCMVVSAEGVAWADEIAMQDRFLFVRPENPQDRRSLRVDRPGRLQWDDVQDLQSEYDRELWRVARWFVDGVSSEEVLTRLPGWVDQLGAPKGRGDVPSFVAAVGARAVATWLHGVKAAAGDAWPGNAPEWDVPEYRGWGWIVREADAMLNEARNAGPRFNTLVNTVVPAVMRSSLQGTSGKALTSLVLENVDASSELTLRRSVQSAVQLSTDIETALPMVLVDKEGHVWVWTQATASWYEQRFRHKAEARINGPKALADQIAGVEDNPPWATYREHKSGGRSYDRPGVRVGKRDAGRNRAIYRRMNAEASAAVLNGGI